MSLPNKMPETKAIGRKNSTEVHWVEWAGLLPPPPDTPCVPWCSGCRIDRYKNALEQIADERPALDVGTLGKLYIERMRRLAREALEGNP